MIPKFIQPCFIRKNTPELRKKLEELGYTIMMGYDTGFIMTSPINGVAYIPTGQKVEISDDYGKYIDCGVNEQLFLALAALREDSDKFQWFVWDEEVTLIPRLGKYIPKGGFSFCVIDKFEPIMFDAPYHKATPEELIEHFKDK